MVRYYGFLSNRKRGTLLRKVYKALEMETRKKPEKPGFAMLMKGYLRTDPYKNAYCVGTGCVLLVHRQANMRRS